MYPSTRLSRFVELTPLCATFNNICDFIENTQNDTDEKVVPLCIPCIHWVTQHINAPPHVIFPIIYLEYFLRSLETYDNKCFDRRTVWRLCKNLASKHQEKHNYYLTLFDTQTQETIHKIARGGTESVAFVIANAFHEKHGKMMFAPSRRLSEFLRDALVNKDV